jgi:hypothetical protein
MAKKQSRTAKKSGRATAGFDPLQLFGGGDAISEALVRKELGRLRQVEAKALEEAVKVRQSNARLLGEIQGLHLPHGHDPKNAKAIAALLASHEKLAAKKLVPPVVKGGIGGTLAGEISATLVPPFDFDVVIPTQLAGPPAEVSGLSSKVSGQMTASAVSSSTRGFGGGSMFTAVGIYFHPPTAGTLSVSAKPKFSFQRWTNSLGTSPVRSFGSVGLTVFGVDVASQTTGSVGTIVSTAGSTIFSWDTSLAGQIDLDFGFDREDSATTSLAVNHTLVYLLFVEAEVHVEGVGWPGSLAGAKLSVTVPSISYDYQVTQVATA